MASRATLVTEGEKDVLGFTVAVAQLGRFGPALGSTKPFLQSGHAVAQLER